MRTWFTSDLHFGHEMVARHRGFINADEHDQEIFENWHKKVKADDTVYVLGDVTLRHPELALEVLNDLPGVKHLVAGNHDPVHPMHRHSYKVQRDWLNVFASVQQTATKRIGGHRVLLSHFPYTADRDEIRYPQWRLPDLGAWLLHGHTHGPERLHGHEVHVGLDAWDFTPVPEHVIAQLIADASNQ